jgi:hypothetical protein
MKRTVVFVLVIAFLLSACIPGLPGQQPADDSPPVDTQATDEALAATMAAETLNSLPTPTLEPTNTPEPTTTYTVTATEMATDTLTPDPIAAITETLRPDPNTTTTATDTATATGTASTITATGTLPSPSPTETLYARFYGTLPPSIPYGKIKLINKSKAEVYVSLQCTTVDGYITILEYPVPGRMRVSAPAGKYTYVAWVGGRQFQGWFGLSKKNEVEIIFEKDKVTVK